MQTYMGDGKSLPNWQNLEDAQQWMFNLFSDVGKGFMTNMEAFLKEVVTLLGDVFQLVIDLILAMKIPKSFFNGLISNEQDKVTSDVNLLCLMMSLPIDVVKDLWAADWSTE